MPTKAINLHILHTGDMHGNLDELPYLATIVRKERARKPGLLLLDAGDWARGHELSEQLAGKPVIEIMNEMGYAAAGVGEGDLSWGLAALRQRAREARFPILAANLRDAQGEPVAELAPYALAETEGLRVALIGLCCDDCAIPGETTVLPAAAVLSQVTAQVQEAGADVIIVLSHLGLEADQELAATSQHIACIVGGHSHDELDEPEIVGGTVICHPGAEAHNLGSIQLQLAPPASPARTRPAPPAATC